MTLRPVPAYDRVRDDSRYVSPGELFIAAGVFRPYRWRDPRRVSPLRRAALELADTRKDPA